MNGQIENGRIKNEAAFNGGEAFFNQLRESGVADDKFVRELVTMFLDEGRRGLDTLYDAIHRKDLNEIKLNAHKLKSSFKMFELNEILPDIKSLEKTNEENVNQMSKYIAILKHKCADAFRLIELKYL